MNKKIEIDTEKNILIFRINMIVKNEELKRIREELKKQVKEGIVLIDKKIDLLKIIKKIY